MSLLGDSEVLGSECPSLGFVSLTSSEAILDFDSFWVSARQIQILGVGQWGLDAWLSDDRTTLYFGTIVAGFDW